MRAIFLLLAAVSAASEVCDYVTGDLLPADIFKFSRLFKVTEDDRTAEEIREIFADTLNMSYYRVRVDETPTEKTYFLRLMVDFCYRDHPNATAASKALEFRWYVMNETMYQNSDLYKEGFTTFDLEYGLKDVQLNGAPETICNEILTDTQRDDFVLDTECEIAPTPAPPPEEDPNVLRKWIGSITLGSLIVVLVSSFWTWWKFYDIRQDKILEMERKKKEERRRKRRASRHKSRKSRKSRSKKSRTGRERRSHKERRSNKEGREARKEEKKELILNTENREARIDVEPEEKHAD